MNRALNVEAARRAPVRCMLRFESLFHEGRGLAFPCDRDGTVEMDALSERARANYLFARTLIGREFRWPVVAAAT